MRVNLHFKGSEVEWKGLECKHQLQNAVISILSSYIIFWAFEEHNLLLLTKLLTNCSMLNGKEVNVQTR